jgi:hypothetical protein
MPSVTVQIVEKSGSCHVMHVTCHGVFCKMLINSGLLLPLEPRPAAAGADHSATESFHTLHTPFILSPSTRKGIPHADRLAFLPGERSGTILKCLHWRLAHPAKKASWKK